jgi:hypothetical protein
MPDETSELDRLDPEPRVIKLSTGFTLELARLRTRQFFRLLKVLTHGAGPAMMRAGLDFKGDGEQFAQQLIMLVIMSIPDAEAEAIAFLQSMCKPAGLIDKADSQLTKTQAAENKGLWDEFNQELFNPDPADTLDIIEQIVLQEAPELQALGKKLQKMLELFRATGQDKETKEPDPTPEEMSASQAHSPQPSTSSAVSTDGVTTTSSTSRSAASARSSKQRQTADAASTPPG